MVLASLIDRIGFGGLPKEGRGLYGSDVLCSANLLRIQRRRDASLTSNPLTQDSMTNQDLLNLYESCRTSDGFPEEMPIEEMNMGAFNYLEGYLVDSGFISERYSCE
jgi:hypothetical protein